MVTEHDINVILEELNHTLSPEQDAIVRCNGREILGGGGERAGKSWVAAEYLNVRSAIYDNGLYWISGKDYDRTHAEFEYIAQAMLQLEGVRPEDIHTPSNGQWHLKLICGTQIKTWSLQDWLKVGSEAPDGIIIAEVAQIGLTEYIRLTDRTAEKRGWVIGTGTFEGSLGWYPEKWKLYQLPGQSGQSFSLPSWSNKHVYPGGYEDEEIQRLKEKHSEDYFLERFGGIPCPPKGLVFPEFKYLTHVKEMDIEDSPIYLYIDPGYAGAYAVEVIQIDGETIRVVDEIYEKGLVTEQIIDICMTKDWWKLVVGGVADIAVRQHQAQPAVEEIWSQKAKLSLNSNYVKEEEGRERLHTFLTINPIDHQPRMFVAPHCTGILSEFGVCPNPFSELAAPYKWGEDRFGNVSGEHPKDENNHGIKAITYGIVDKFGFVRRNRSKKTEVHSFYPGRRQ